MKRIFLGLALCAGMLFMGVTSASAYCSLDPTLGIGLPVHTSLNVTIGSPGLKPDAAPAVYLAAVLLFTPVTAVALIGGSRLLGEGVLCFRRNPATGFHRRQPVDLVFNTSRFMTAGALSALAYGAAGASIAGAVVATAVM